MSEYVILVNAQDEAQGLMEKMEAHEKGLLHRAISVFILNDKGELLLQRRALHKYHSAGLWTNTCCTHPRDGEEPILAAHRRLEEEMGMQCELEKIFAFVYKAEFDNGLTEHEFDHVFLGYSNENPEINPEEVDQYAWVSMEKVKHELENNAEAYTAWFKIIFQRFVDHIHSMRK